MLTVVSVSGAQAQSWDNLLRALGLGGQPAQQTATAAAHLSEQQLQATWVYSSPATGYDGNDALAAVGVKTLESMLPSLYLRAGLSEGNGTVEFRPDGVLEARIGDHKVTGRYELSRSDGRLTLSARVGDVAGQLNGRASVDDGELTLLLDASEAARLVERVSSKASSNEKFRLMKALLDKYPGIFIGCKMMRR